MLKIIKKDRSQRTLFSHNLIINSYIYRFYILISNKNLYQSFFLIFLIMKKNTTFFIEITFFIYLSIYLSYLFF